ncbi:MAG: ThiF family adenylyltransferase [Verrucomicrobiota bacterium]
MNPLEKPWWELWPGRLEYELKQLESAHIEHRLIPELERRGIIGVDLRLWHEGQDFVMRAVFPSTYPFFRPDVFAKPGTFRKHQNPFVGNLCLLGRATFNWNTSDTLATLIQEQFPKLFASATSHDSAAVALLEEHQGEPASAFYTYAKDSIILITGTDGARPAINGNLELRIDFRRMPSIHGWLTDLRAPNGQKLLNSTTPAPNHYKQVIGKWFALPEAPPSADGLALEKWLLEKGLIKRATFDQRHENWGIDVTGIVFPEEITYGQQGDGWLFLLRTRGERSSGTRIEIIRAGRVSSDDFAVRIPSLRFLRSKHITLFGLGALGANAALELARSGVGKLSLVDFDFVEPGSVVRWPLGLQSAGFSKTTSLKAFIEAQYPWTNIKTFEHRVGAAAQLFDKDERMILKEELAEADIILDLTTETGVHQMLSFYARLQQVPYVYGYATPGGVGGLVARFDSRRQMGCWLCLQRALYQTKTIPEPPFLDDGSPQPPGCAERTFTGAAFDLAEVTLEAVKMTVSSISPRMPGDYPPTDWDVSVLSMRSAAEQRLAPVWSRYSLPPDPECKCT